jgi:superfamily I DNA and RNA helicase
MKSQGLSRKVSKEDQERDELKGQKLSKYLMTEIDKIYQDSIKSRPSITDKTESLSNNVKLPQAVEAELSDKTEIGQDSIKSKPSITDKAESLSNMTKIDRL